MARLSQSEKDLLLADYHTGQYSQRDLAKKYDVSTATVNKMTKGVEPKHKDKVNAQIAINTQLSLESEQEVNAVHKIVDIKTKHLIYFQNSALKNQDLANKAIEKINNPTKDDLYNLEQHSRITAKNKETVIGKDVITPNEEQSDVIEVEIE